MKNSTEELNRKQAGFDHTVLLREDGTVVAIGDDSEGQCSVPALPPGRKYIAVAAGAFHTVLLRDDGTAVAVGRTDGGICDIPDPPEGRKYVAVAAGFDHTVLMLDDGSVAIGR